MGDLHLSEKQGQDHAPLPFMQMDKLRVWGPVAIREWLARERPVGRALVHPGQVVQFDRPRA